MALDPALRDELKSLLGDGLLLSAEETVAYECDALTAHRHRPGAVALPRRAGRCDMAKRVRTGVAEAGSVGRPADAEGVENEKEGPGHQPARSGWLQD